MYFLKVENKLINVNHIIDVDYKPEAQYRGETGVIHIHCLETPMCMTFVGDTAHGIWKNINNSVCIKIRDALV